MRRKFTPATMIQMNSEWYQVEKRLENGSWLLKNLINDNEIILTQKELEDLWDDQQLEMEKNKIYIDHDEFDLYLVDDSTQLAIGKPTFTFLADTGNPSHILGLQLSFGPPSWKTVSECLRKVIFRDDEVSETHESSPEKAVWQHYEIPVINGEKIIEIDNSKELSTCFIEKMLNELAKL